MELILVRHGETRWNAERRIQGHLDIPLSHIGRLQAEAVAGRLAGESYAALYSSDLSRAFDTARRIAAITGQAIITEVRLRERHYGLFQGLTRDEARLRYPEEYHLHAQGDPDYVIPGGESLHQKQIRVMEGIDDLASRHRGGRVLVVTHGGVLDSLLRHTLQIPLGVPRHYSVLNAAVHTFVLESNKWRLTTWGDISHLHHIGRHG